MIKLKAQMVMLIAFTKKTSEIQKEGEKQYTAACVFVWNWSLMQKI